MCAFTVRAFMKTEIIQEKIAKIVSEMSLIIEFVEGSISSSSNTYKLKDGTCKKSAPHWKFQTLGARGKRKYINIPKKHVPIVKELIKNGKRYRKLEQEYTDLITEINLDALKKN